MMMIKRGCGDEFEELYGLARPPHARGHITLVTLRSLRGSLTKPVSRQSEGPSDAPHYCKLTLLCTYWGISCFEESQLEVQCVEKPAHCHLPGSLKATAALFPPTGSSTTQPGVYSRFQLRLQSNKERLAVQLLPISISTVMCQLACSVYFYISSFCLIHI